MIKQILYTLVRSISNTIGRVIAYVILGFIAFFIYSTFFKADTIETLDIPLKTDYIDYFSRIIDNKNYFNTDYLAFTHNCDNSICYTLLTGDIETILPENDKELIKVDNLPTSSEDTQGKIYQLGNKYYVTEKTTSEFLPIPLNEDLKGKTIYIDYKSITYDLINDLYVTKKIEDGQNIVNFKKISPDTYNNVQMKFFKNSVGNISVNHYTLFLPSLNSNVKNSFSILENGEYHSSFDSFSSNYSFYITEWLLPEFSQYFSLAPFEMIYSWKEIKFSNNNDFMCKKCEYVTFKENETTIYDTGTYEDFKITGSVIYSNLGKASLERSTNYEKGIALCLFFIISFCIVYKLLHK